MSCRPSHPLAHSDGVKLHLNNLFFGSWSFFCFEMNIAPLYFNPVSAPLYVFKIFVKYIANHRIFPGFMG